MQRYFKNAECDVYSLSNDDSHHILRVMRLSIGANVEVVNNEKLYITEIIDTTDNIVTVKNVEEVLTNNELSVSVTLVQAAVKEQKMDYILQKSCELGVSEIIVLNTNRSIVKLDSKETKKIERWNKILKEASEQSKRNVIPIVKGIMNLSDIIGLDYDIKILCTVNEFDNNVKRVLSKVNNGDRIIFIVGPEGGFTEEEERKLTIDGYLPISLGRRVLRTETASLFMLSLINYEFME